MPLPMVHLTVAVRRYESDGTLPPPAFLLGSLAPDAIHMRPGAGREDKARTHLLEPPDTAHHAAIRDLLGRYRTADRELADFAAGYAAHLLTDRHWAEAVYRPFRQALPPTLDPASRRELYYRETDQLDFDLYHHRPWRPRVWELLALAPARDFADLLKAEEIERWRDRTLRWFGELKEESGITPTYCTETALQSFIRESSDLVATFLGARETAPDAP